MGEKGNVLHGGNDFVCARFTVQKPVNNSALDEMFFDQFGNVRWF